LGANGLWIIYQMRAPASGHKAPVLETEDARAVGAYLHNHSPIVHRWLRLRRPTPGKGKRTDKSQTEFHQQPFLPPLEGFDIGFIGLLGFFAMVIS
jgi:hypothetical protein